MSEDCSDRDRPSLTELANRFGTDKGTQPGDWGVAHRYAAIYERFLAHRRLEPLRLLELGVWKGASLRMRESFFAQRAHCRVENLADIVQDQPRR